MERDVAPKFFSYVLHPELYKNLRALARNHLQPRVQGRNPARFKGGYWVPRGFKGGSKTSAPCGRLSEAEHPKRKGSNPVATFERGKSKSPPNPLGLAERVPRPADGGRSKRWKAFIPIAFMPNILLFSDARQAYEAQEAYEAYEE